MHFDYVGDEIKDSKPVGIAAFQKVWNLAHPTDKLAEDGEFGIATADRLLHSPVEGFPGLPIPRILCFTSPLQMGKDVGALQLALRTHGVAVDKADMIFGAILQMAVEEFQQKNGLTVDGVVGGKMRKALGL